MLMKDNTGEDCFTRADEFLPERWYSKPEMVKNKHAFTPFALGRFNCIGKNFALNELRLTVAALIQKYNVTLAPGYEAATVFRDTRDAFTSDPGRLDLIFSLVDR